MKKLVSAMAVAMMAAVGTPALADVPEACRTFEPDIRGLEFVRDKVAGNMAEAAGRGDHATLMGLAGEYATILEQLVATHAAMLECIRTN